MSKAPRNDTAMAVRRGAAVSGNIDIASRNQLPYSVVREKPEVV